MSIYKEFRVCEKTPNSHLRLAYQGKYKNHGLFTCVLPVSLGKNRRYILSPKESHIADFQDAKGTVRLLTYH